MQLKFIINARDTKCMQIYNVNARDTKCIQINNKCNRPKM